MSKKKYNKADFTLLITSLLIISLGAIMVFSSSWPVAISEFGNAYYFLKRHLIWMLLGTISMFIFMNIDYKIWQRYSKIIFGLSIFLGLLVLISPLGVERKGAKRWLNLGIVFMPSDLIKIASIIFFADFLVNNRKKIGTTLGGTIPGALIIGITISTVVANDLGTTIIIVGSLGTMFFMGGLKILDAVVVIIAGFFGILNFAKKGFRSNRLIAFKDPFKYRNDEGWQIVESLHAIGSGGIFGVGLGKSRQKYFYISEAYNDFIFSILAEELGLVGCVLVIILYSVLIWKGFMVSMKIKDYYGKYLSIGIISLITIQSLVHIAVVTSSIPTTGVTLPLMSYGGTSLIVTMSSIGILLNISRQID